MWQKTEWRVLFSTNLCFKLRECVCFMACLACFKQNWSNYWVWIKPKNHKPVPELVERNIYRKQVFFFHMFSLSNLSFLWIFPTTQWDSSGFHHARTLFSLVAQASRRGPATRSGWRSGCSWWIQHGFSGKMMAISFKNMAHREWQMIE